MYVQYVGILIVEAIQLCAEHMYLYTIAVLVFVRPCVCAHVIDCTVGLIDKTTFKLNQIVQLMEYACPSPQDKCDNKTPVLDEQICIPSSFLPHSM